MTPSPRSNVSKNLAAMLAEIAKPGLAERHHRDELEDVRRELEQELAGGARLAKRVAELETALAYAEAERTVARDAVLREGLEVERLKGELASARLERDAAEQNERTALDAMSGANAPRVLDFVGGAEPKTFSGPVSLDELEEAIAATRKGTEVQAFREGVIAARDATCPGCGEGAPLTLSGTHHRGGSAGCCTNLCKAAAIRRELLGEEVGKIGTFRAKGQIMGG